MYHLESYQTDDCCGSERSMVEELHRQKKEKGKCTTCAILTVEVGD